MVGDRNLSNLIVDFMQFEIIEIRDINPNVSHQFLQSKVGLLKHSVCGVIPLSTQITTEENC